MEQRVLRTRLYWIAAGYAAVVAVSAGLIVVRYLQYAMHPQDAAQYGGMWAGGDLMLELFICAMLLGMTFILALAIRGSESAYTVYSKAMLGFSLTFPLSVTFIATLGTKEGVAGVVSLIGWACLFRVFASPVVIITLFMSFVFAKFSRARKLALYALLVEVSTLLLMMGFMFSLSRFHLG